MWNSLLSGKVSVHLVLKEDTTLQKDIYMWYQEEVNSQRQKVGQSLPEAGDRGMGS